MRLSLGLMYNAAIAMTLCGMVAAAATTGAGGVVPLVRPTAMVANAFQYQVAPAAFVIGLSMIGIDVARNHELGGLAAKGTVAVLGGGFSLMAGDWLSLYGATGSVI